LSLIMPTPELSVLDHLIGSTAISYVSNSAVMAAVIICPVQAMAV
jgi:hypothetical protein